MQNNEIAVLRLKTKQYLETYYGVEKIIIPRDLLERLLFEMIEVNIQGIWYRVKVPVWSGEFLSKVDLSEISFKDVLWDYNICLALNNSFIQILQAIQQMRMDNLISSTSSYQICYANTNAHIDFTQSFIFNVAKSADLSKYDGLISAANCNFSGTNVEIGEGVSAIQFLNSNFSKSQIVIPKIDRLTIRDSDLSDNDLSHLYIDGLSNHFQGTNFRNSGINISLDASKLESYLEMDREYFKKVFITRLNNYYVGCNVNGNYLEYHEDEEYNLKLILKG